MSAPLHSNLRRILAISCVFAAGIFFSMGVAEAAPCDRAQYPADVPAVDTGLPVVQIWTLNGSPIVDRDKTAPCWATFSSARRSKSTSTASTSRRWQPPTRRCRIWRAAT
jgi:hypothetical protein